MIYGKVLQAMDENEKLNYASLRNDLLNRLADERYALTQLVKRQSEVIANYNMMLDAAEATKNVADQVRTFERMKEEKYGFVFKSDKDVTEVYLKPMKDND